MVVVLITSNNRHRRTGFAKQIEKARLLFVIDSAEFFIKDFAKAINEQAAAAFVGAGLSQGAGYVGWEGLVADLARRLELPLTKDLLTLAQFVVNRDRGRSLINQRIVQEFARPREPTDAHMELVKLPFKTFWTTNYDSLIETALTKYRGLPEVKRSQEDLARHIPDRSATVFKMHGEAESPQEAVLVREDYEKYSRQRELFIDVFTADLLMKTFVFVGVSFNDPNLMFLLGRLHSIFGGSRKKHFWITKRPEAESPESELFDLRVEDLREYGIQTVILDRHEDLAPLLARVNIEYVTMRRRNSVFFSGSVKDDNPRAQEIRDFAQKLGEKLVLRGVTIITGLGRGIGTWVTTGALEAIYKTSDYEVASDRVRARPFPVGSATDEKARSTHRARMISDSGFSVFICRTSFRGEKVSGTREEYDIARNNGSYVLPIGATGNESAELWKLTLNDFDQVFGSGHNSIRELFMSLNNPSLPLRAHVETICKIIDDLRDSHL